MFGSSSATTNAFYQGLEKMLRQQLVRNPADQSTRAKLIELYHETSHTELFLREAERYKARMSESGSADWHMILALGRQLLPSEALFKEEPRAAQPTTPKASIEAPPPPGKRFGEDPQFKALFDEAAKAYETAQPDPRFQADIDLELVHYAGRPTPLLHARRLSEHLKGAQIFLKREDLAPAGTHVMIAVVGQALLARRMGRDTIVLGTAFGARGVIVAAVAARLGLKAIIYMDSDDAQDHSASIFRMWLLGATVETVDKDAYGGDIRNAGLQAWASAPKERFLIVGLDAAPAPYPMIARECAAIIGRETLRQVRAQARRAPDLVVTRASGSADALGLFPPLLESLTTRLVCVEARSTLDVGAPETASAEVSMNADIMQSAQRALDNIAVQGLSYPAVTREHAWLKATGRVEYVDGDTGDARQAITLLAENEGIISSIQTAHVLAWAFKAARSMAKDQCVVVSITEQPDKDIRAIGKSLGIPFF